MKLYALLYLCIGAAVCAASGGEPLPPSAKASLCSLLETVENGGDLPAVVSGIYAVDYEFQVLYDPEQPECEIDVQPSTWVEFSPTVKGSTPLDLILKQDKRAYVTFKGTLVGPDGVLVPDDPSLPWMIVYAKRTGHRYGHLNSFRTQFVVDAVVEAKPVPATVPWDMRIGHKYGHTSLDIESAEMPRYPPFARRAGLSGEVEIEVKVQFGEGNRDECQNRRSNALRRSSDKHTNLEIRIRCDDDFHHEVRLSA